ncbi:unnamed protein product [Closterium sp. NIES-65]|nr:unnamed protein product [Closterium sp. NIES-65]
MIPAAAFRAQFHSHIHSCPSSAISPAPPQQPGAAATGAQLHAHPTRPLSPQTPTPLPAGEKAAQVAVYESPTGLAAAAGSKRSAMTDPQYALTRCCLALPDVPKMPNCSAFLACSCCFCSTHVRSGALILSALLPLLSPALSPPQIAEACHAGDNHVAMAAVDKGPLLPALTFPSPALSFPPCFPPPTPTPFQIAEACHAGDNHVAMAAIDKRPFCIGVRIIRKRSFDEVMAIPPVDVGELLESLLARISDGHDSSSGRGESLQSALAQVERPASTHPSNISCTLSPSPPVPVDCSHTILPLFPDEWLAHSRGRAIQGVCAHGCPVCMKLYALDSLIIDPFFHRVCEEVCSL